MLTEFCDVAEFSVIAIAPLLTLAVMPPIEASVAFNSASVETWPAPLPNVMTWLAPPLTAMVKVWPAVTPAIEQVGRGGGAVQRRSAKVGDWRW